MCAWQAFASVSGQIWLYLLSLSLKLQRRLPSSRPDALLLLLLLLLFLLLLLLLLQSLLLEFLMLLVLLMLCWELTASVCFILLLQGILQGIKFLLARLLAPLFDSLDLCRCFLPDTAQFLCISNKMWFSDFPKLSCNRDALR